MRIIFFIFIIISNKVFSDIPKPVYPIPWDEQTIWQRDEINAFFHFSLNGYYNREWGDGTEDPKIFNPLYFDANEWVSTAKSMGARAILIVTKHHSGFHLFDHPDSDYDAANTPWGRATSPPRDMVRELREAATAHGLKFSVYISPWDRHHPSYKVDRKKYEINGEFDEAAYEKALKVYDDFFVKTIKFVIDNYRPIQEFWFDGAGLGIENGREQLDRKRYYQTIREFSPKSIIAVAGPDVKWVGNEEGDGPLTNWAPRLASGLSDEDENKTEHIDSSEFLKCNDCVGDKSLIWRPVECDTTILTDKMGIKKWFWWKTHQVKSTETLFDLYFSSVGRNCALLLNLSPSTDGRIPHPQKVSVKGLGDSIEATFSDNLLVGSSVITSEIRGENYDGGKAIDKDRNTYWTTGDQAGWHFESNKSQKTAWIQFSLPAEITFDIFSVSEYTPLGQRVSEFIVETKNTNGKWVLFSKGTTIGNKRLLRVEKPVTTKQIKLTVTASRDIPLISEVGVFKYRLIDVDTAPKIEPELRFSPSAILITLLSTSANDTLHFTTDGSPPTTSSPIYTAPFLLSFSTRVKVLSINTGLTTEREYIIGDLIDLISDKSYAYQSSDLNQTMGQASLAIDNNRNGNFRDGSVSHTATEANPWLEIDLGQEAFVHKIVITNRTDCCQDRLKNITVIGSTVPFISKKKTSVLNQPGIFIASTGEKIGINNEILVNRQLRYIRLQAFGSNRIVSVAEVKVKGVPRREVTNIALNQPTRQSTSSTPSKLAVDGNTSGNWQDNSISQTANPQEKSWWQVDLGTSKRIQNIIIWNRTDCCSDELNNFRLLVSDTPRVLKSIIWQRQVTSAVGESKSFNLGCNTFGRYITVLRNTSGKTTLAELEVFSNERSLGVNIATGKPTQQSSTLPGGESAKAVDGNTNGDFSKGSVTATNLGDNTPWWQIDLLQSNTVGMLKIYPRTDCCKDGLQRLRILISENEMGDTASKVLISQGQVEIIYFKGDTSKPFEIPVGYTGRYIRVDREQSDEKREPLSLAEVEVFTPMVGL